MTMLKLRFILGLLLFCLSFSALMQDEEAPSYRIRGAVENISAILLEGEADASAVWQLTFTGFQDDACQSDWLSQQAAYPHNIEIQLYRQIPPTADCIREERPFEVHLALEADMTAPYLIVNHQVWEISYPDSDSLTQGAVLRFKELSLREIFVDAAALRRVDGDSPRYELTIQGSHAVGCRLPVLYSRHETAESVLIGAFNPIAADTVCPAMLLPLDETLTLPATHLAADALFGVNAYIINELENQPMSDSTQVMTLVNSVTVHVKESFPMQISLDVVGEHPDGCDYPVVIEQSRQGHIIKVVVYREVPVDVVCPMILQPYQSTVRLNGSFESGRYIIRVNNLSQTIDI